MWGGWGWGQEFWAHTPVNLHELAVGSQPVRKWFNVHVLHVVGNVRPPDLFGGGGGS